MRRLGGSGRGGFLSGSQWQSGGAHRRRQAGGERFAAGQSRNLIFHTVLRFGWFRLWKCSLVHPPLVAPKSPGQDLAAIVHDSIGQQEFMQMTATALASGESPLRIANCRRHQPGLWTQ